MSDPVLGRPAVPRQFAWNEIPLLPRIPNISLGILGGVVLVDLFGIPLAEDRSGNPDDVIWTGLPIGLALGAVLVAGLVPWLQARSLRRSLSSLRKDSSSSRAFIGVIGSQPREDTPVLAMFGGKGLVVYVTDQEDPRDSWSWHDLRRIEIAGSVRGHPLLVTTDAPSGWFHLFVMNDDGTTFSSDGQTRGIADEMNALRDNSRARGSAE